MPENSIDRSFEDAFRCHQAGQLAEAEQGYRAILARDPRHADSLHLLGVLASQAGKADIAVAFITEATVVRPDVALYHCNLGNVLVDQARYEEAAAAYRQAIALKANFAEAHSNLGNIYRSQGKLDAALSEFERALAVKPDLPEAHNNLGNTLKDQGKLDAARESYVHAITLRPNYAEALFNLANVLKDQDALDAAISAYERSIAVNPNLAPVHCNLGNVLWQQGKRDEAIACYRRAISLAPEFSQAHSNLGNALKDQGKLDEAVAAYERALELDPDYTEAYFNLGNALKAQGKREAAEIVYREAITLRPDFAEAHHNLGNIYESENKLGSAQVHLERALALKPDDADIQICLGNVLLRLGNREKAENLFRRAQALQPVSRRPCTKAQAAFSVLVVGAPGAGNTPCEYLMGDAGYDANFMVLLAGSDYDVALLRDCGDVVINLVSDVDQGRDLLPLAADLLDRLERPVINHARTIMATGREAVAARLAHVPHCRIPKITRVAGKALATAPQHVLAGYGFPVLLRPCGTHGGDDFEKFHDLDAVAAFASRNPAVDYYVIEYIPYESADGYFRKYRLIFTDGRVFPYHLAIASGWKVHHFSTDMANQEWMRAEEEAFVSAPERVFAPEHWAALETIRRAIGLDYFGIDCALDQDGRLVVFEVNATMLVHDEAEIFAYKQPYIARIKQAFEAMLAKAADGSNP